MHRPPSPSRRRSRPSRWLWLAAIAVAAGALLVFARPAALAAPSVASTDAPPPAATTGDDDAAARSTSDRTDVEAAGSREPAAGADAAGADRTFEWYVEELTSLGEATARLATAGDTSQARASDQAARELFGELLDRYADAGERALQMVAGMPAPTAAPAATFPPPIPAADDTAAATTPVPLPQTIEIDPRNRARRLVLRLVLATDCARRDASAAAVGDRTRIDALTQATLDVMPANATTAEFGAGVLAGKPYLRLVHEPTVLSLVRLAADGAFPREVATRLLTTLWDNLQRSGERTSDEVAALALLLLADTDAGKRAAASRHLLRDARYRHVVLAWLRDAKDGAIAAEISTAAAQDLAPADALAVLRELAPLTGRQTGPYMTLGFRAPDALADAYQELLAANVQPAVRADLVAGLGLARSPLGVQVTQLALESDPAVDVRIQAGFALTAAAAETLGETTCARLLDDPAVASSARHLGAVVSMLQNLEAAGLTNAIDRLGQRLRTMALGEQARRELDELLARALPGGRTSR